MTKIQIDDTGSGTWWLYGAGSEWKLYCGCEDFDEEVVLCGNDRLSGVKEASWYAKVMEVLNDIDCYDEYPEDVESVIRARMEELYDACVRVEDIVVDFARLLFPDDTFRSGTITGYSQGDWQNYIVRGDVNIDLVEALYFGKVSEVFVENGDDEFSDIITHDELWEAERGDLTKYMRERYDIPEAEELRIYKADGVVTTPNWEEVC